MAKHLSPPLSRHSTFSSRKYQQRLAWQRLPPSVPMLRICGPAIAPAAITRAGAVVLKLASAAIAASFVPAPIVALVRLCAISVNALGPTPDRLITFFGRAM